MIDKILFYFSNYYIKKLKSIKILENFFYRIVLFIDENIRKKSSTTI